MTCSLCIHFATVFFALVTSLSMCPRQIAVFDHVLEEREPKQNVSQENKSTPERSTYSDLSLHRDKEQGNKIEQKNGPKNWNIAKLKEGTNQSNQSCLG